jgi:hypothetical protein
MWKEMICLCLWLFRGSGFNSVSLTLLLPEPRPFPAAGLRSIVFGRISSVEMELERERANSMDGRGSCSDLAMSLVK